MRFGNDLPIQCWFSSWKNEKNCLSRLWKRGMRGLGEEEIGMRVVASRWLAEGSVAFLIGETRESRAKPEESSTRDYIPLSWTTRLKLDAHLTHLFFSLAHTEFFLYYRGFSLLLKLIFHSPISDFWAFWWKKREAGG